jgi:hypothetical protein
MVVQGSDQCQRPDSSEIRLRILWPKCLFPCRRRGRSWDCEAVQNTICFRMSLRRGDVVGLGGLPLAI